MARSAPAAFVLLATVCSAAADPVDSVDSGAWILVESELQTAPWQRATDLTTLDAEPPPAPGEEGAWLERRARLADGAQTELLSLAALHRPDALRADTRLRTARALISVEPAREGRAEAADTLLAFSAPPDRVLERDLLASTRAGQRGEHSAADTTLREAVTRLDPREVDPRESWCNAAEGVGVAAPDRSAPFLAAYCAGDTPTWESGPTPDVSEALLLTGIWRYRRGDGELAREALRRLAEHDAAPLAERCQAHVWLARSEERTGDDAAAPPLQDWVIEHCRADDDAMVRALYGRGRACAEAGNRECAETHIERLIAEYPAATHVDDALSTLADLYRRLGDEAAVWATIERALTLDADGDLWREAVWRVVRPLLDSEPERAVGVLRRAIAAFDWDATYYSQGRFEYFLGRGLEVLGRSAEAESAWLEAIARYPLTFYARLACDALEESTLPCPWPARSGPVEPAVWPVSDCLEPGQRWHLLVAAGLLAEAADSLAPPAGDCDSARWIRALLADRVGHYEVSHDIARREIVGWQRHLGDTLSDRRWSVAYPRPHLALVTGEAERTGLRSELIYGVMREESGFRRGIHSYAGAQGLMQLMPATARGHAEGVEGAITVERLADPAVNIRIGANFLAHLGRHLDSEPILMVAAYNAGRGRVRGWLRERPYGAPGLWVEAIGPRQTRDYTKRVLGSLEVYRYLYGEETTR